MHAATVVAQGLAMMTLPVAAATLARRRWADVGAGALVAGAAAFIGSQIVHVPLNVGVARLAAEGVVPTAPPWAVPLLLGLSAGLCEESARWVSLRGRRTFGEAVVTGVGHGGVEAVLLGGLVLVSAVQLAALVSGGAPPEAQAAVDAFVASPDALALAGVVERAAAVTAHVAMSVLVGLAVARRSVVPWLAAVAVHAAFDAGAVALLPWGVWWVEGFCAAFAAVAAALAVVAARGWPAAPVPEAPPLAPPPPLARRPLDLRDVDALGPD